MQTTKAFAAKVGSFETQPGVSKTPSAAELAREGLPEDERKILDIVEALGLSRGEAIQRLSGRSAARAAAFAKAVADPDQEECEPKANPVVYEDPDFAAALAQARPVALMIMRRAVVDYLAAKAVHDAAYLEFKASEAYKAGGRTCEMLEWESWTGVSRQFMDEAETRIVACVLMLHGVINWPSKANALQPGWNPVSFEIDDAIYVVSQPEWATDEGPKLTIIWPSFTHSSCDGYRAKFVPKGVAR